MRSASDVADTEVQGSMIHFRSEPVRVMAKQSTLFGKAVSKEPFFKNAGLSSPYCRVVNALWQLEGGENRREFLKNAQKKWTDIYADDAEARTRLFVRAKTEEGYAGKSLCAAAILSYCDCQSDFVAHDEFSRRFAAREWWLG